MEVTPCSELYSDCGQREKDAAVLFFTVCRLYRKKKENMKRRGEKNGVGKGKKKRGVRGVEQRITHAAGATTGCQCLAVSGRFIRFNCIGVPMRSTSDYYYYYY